MLNNFCGLGCCEGLMATELSWAEICNELGMYLTCLNFSNECEILLVSITHSNSSNCLKNEMSKKQNYTPLFNSYLWSMVDSKFSWQQLNSWYPFCYHPYIFFLYILDSYHLRRLPVRLSLIWTILLALINRHNVLWFLVELSI